MNKLIKFLLLSTLMSASLGLSGCEEIDKLFGDNNKQLLRLRKQNEQLQKQVDTLNGKLEEARADSKVNTILVSLYDMRHALEKYALDNKGKYPYASNINELQSIIKSYLPDGFEIEPTYLEKVRSQERGYIMIANVKGREIVVSNLL